MEAVFSALSRVFFGLCTDSITRHHDHITAPNLPDYWYSKLLSAGGQGERGESGDACTPSSSPYSSWTPDLDFGGPSASLGKGLAER